MIATAFYLNGTVTVLGLSQSELLSTPVLTALGQSINAFVSAAVNAPITSWSFGIEGVANATGSCAVSVSAARLTHTHVLLFYTITSFSHSRTFCIPHTCTVV